MKQPPSRNARVPGRGFSAALLGLAVIAAGAPPGVGVSGAWMRSVIPSRPAAGYFTLTNDSAATLKLVGASSPGCGMLMLHRSVNRSGQEMMMAANSIAVPAHGKVTFAPGGYHLMCMSPTSAVRPGGTLPVTLRFDNGATLTATFAVRNAMGK